MPLQPRTSIRCGDCRKFLIKPGVQTRTADFQKRSLARCLIISISISTPSPSPSPLQFQWPPHPPVHLHPLPSPNTMSATFYHLYMWSHCRATSPSVKDDNFCKPNGHEMKDFFVATHTDRHNRLVFTNPNPFDANIRLIADDVKEHDRSNAQVMVILCSRVQRHLSPSRIFFVFCPGVLTH